MNPDYFISFFELRHPNSKPYIVLFSNNDKPIAIIIGATFKNNVQVKIGYFKANTPLLNCLDIEIGGLIFNGQNESEKIIVEFLSNLLQQKTIDKIEIQHLPETHPLWKQSKNGLGLKNKAIYKLGIEWIGQIRNPKTREIENKHSSKTRATFRRKDKKLLKYFNDQLEIQVFKTLDQVDHFIDMADSIGKKSYQYAINVGIRKNDYWKNTLSLMAKENYFRGYLLFHNSTPLAYIQGPVFNNVFYLFATSFNPKYRDLSPGGYLLRKVIELLVAEAINKIHFGYGDADYKKLYGTESKVEASFRLYGYTPKAKISKMMDQLSVAVNEFIVTVLNKTGLLNKIKKIWRSKLAQKK